MLVVLSVDWSCSSHDWRQRGVAARQRWVVRGALEVNGTPLAAGDAALLEDESQITLSNGQQAEVLVFELAG